MSDSLRDQLLGLGFKSAPPTVAPARKEQHSRGKRSGASANASLAHARSDRAVASAKTAAKSNAKTNAEFDLAKAYAIRAQKEKDERIEAERQKQEEARLRREARAALAAYLTPDRLLDAGDAADIARHLEYGGKIKRVYVTAEQLPLLNTGELGVVQQNGRYHVVSAETLAECERLFAPAVALKVDPTAPVTDDPYADPKYQVPDDLVW